MNISENLINHFSTCQDGGNCTVPQCRFLRELISHWKRCKQLDCQRCVPVHQYRELRIQMNANLSTPLASGNVGQTGNNAVGNQSAPQPSPNPAATNDAMHRQACEALGVSYPRNPIPHDISPTAPSNPSIRPPNIPPQSSSVSHGESAAAAAASSSSSQFLAGQNPSTLLGLDGSGVISRNSVRGIVATPPRVPKEWHQSVSPDLRNHLIHKLVNAIFPSPDPATMLDRRMSNLVDYAKKVEGDMFEAANSRSEYYHLLAEKIDTIAKELEGKRQKRKEQQQQLQQAFNEQLQNLRGQQQQPRK